MVPLTRSRPAIPRNRLIALIIVGVVAAAVVVALAALATREPPPGAVSAAANRTASEPLPGRPGIVVPPVPGMPEDAARRVEWARALQAERPGVESALRLAGAQLAVDDVAGSVGTLTAAAQQAPNDPRLAAATALAHYAAGHPDVAITTLAALAEASEAAFVRFSYGVTLLWSGRRALGEEQLRAVRDAAPESFYGVAADDLVHPAMPAGYPPFIPSVAYSETDFAALRRAAEAAPDQADPQIAYAVALIAAGRRLEAAEAFGAALAVQPTLVDAKVGRIITGYSKDNPAAAFGQMGPLVRDNPTNPSPRLHLALMLLWLRDFDGARAQLRQVAESSPDSRLGLVAQQFLDAL